MRFPATSGFLRALSALCILFGCVLQSHALDREAFSITKYDLNLQIDPAQHRLGARGTITLRNDTAAPQKIAVLQISSSLNWRAIKVGDKPVQFVTQPYASDIDHTGALSEAIVTLPEAVAPHATVNLDIGYEGIITLDATRLTRIGMPDDVAANTDWDQIGPNASVVRGAGYVAWYPIATDVANLSEENSLFEVLARWKARESGSTLLVHFQTPEQTGGGATHAICSGTLVPSNKQDAAFAWVSCSFTNLGQSAPSFALGNYGIIDRPSITVYNLPTHAAVAESYAEAAENVLPLISDWFGRPHEKAQIVDLGLPADARFETGSLLFIPLASKDGGVTALSAAHQLAHAAISSPRPWIQEGLAHFAQALYLDQAKGRQAALDYMASHRSALLDFELQATTRTPEQNQSLVSTSDDELYRSKALAVWWMLRDMIGDAALKKAIRAYHPEQDKDPSYMPHLIAAQTARDMEWFFDDWVYRDRGLPDFKVESAFSRKAMSDTYLLTVTVDNLGAAGAEVPVRIKFAGGEATKRLEVRAKDRATIRIETPTAAQEVLLNDGSVPESDTANNTFTVPAPEK